MKSFKIIILLLSLPLFVFAQDQSTDQAAVSQQQPTVRAKTKLNTDFGKYKSFAWTETAGANDFIQDAIRDELLARGYQQNDLNSDLIVSYIILDKRTSVTGYVNDYPTEVAGEEVRQPADTTTYTLEPGTLMISMIDRKTSQVVWDGFASGLSTPESFSSTPEKAKEVVRRIFDEFKHRATPIEN
jgi:hypothetical protein